MFILDTNTISYSVYRSREFLLLERNIRATKPSDRWISVVTAHELIAFKYQRMEQTKNMSRSALLKCYYDFDDILKLLSRFQILPFDSLAYEHYLGMPGDVDIFDRRIAAIALAHDFTVVTHDGDFSRIKNARPALKVEDWVTNDYTTR